MALARVWYELFDWEVDAIDAGPGTLGVELRRQMRLELDSGRSVYVSWAGGGGHGDEYHIHWQPVSFCQDEPEFAHEATPSTLWAPLAGQSIEFEYQDDERQVLAVRAGVARVLCCSFRDGYWGMDVLRVCRRLSPEMTNRHPWMPGPVPADLLDVPETPGLSSRSRLG